MKIFNLNATKIKKIELVSRTKYYSSLLDLTRKMNLNSDSFHLLNDITSTLLCAIYFMYFYTL